MSKNKMGQVEAINNLPQEREGNSVKKAVAVKADSDIRLVRQIKVHEDNKAYKKIYEEKGRQEIAGKIAKAIENTLSEVVRNTAERFVRMTNRTKKPMYYDKHTEALVPAFGEATDAIDEYTKKHQSYNCPDLADYKKQYAGLEFKAMDSKECNTILKCDVSPLRDGNCLKYSGNINPEQNGCLWWRYDGRLASLSGVRDYDSYIYGSWYVRHVLVPTVCYPLGKQQLTAMKRVFGWLEKGLIPQLDGQAAAMYAELLKWWSVLMPAVRTEAGKAVIEVEMIRKLIVEKKLPSPFFGCAFDEKAVAERVKAMTEVTAAGESAVVLKDCLLKCDFYRANLQPYEEARLTDTNLGLWDLYEQEQGEGGKVISLADSEPAFVGRSPKLDIRQNGICAIDFGTKSTVVVCRNQDERLQRIGKGDYAKAPESGDYENPTVIELRDLAGFIEAYKARGGRTFTTWEQVTVSHQAAAAYTERGDYSVLRELKQWANDKERRLRITDLQGRDEVVEPYLKLKEGDFDPIEVYAYYLGLYINNLYNGIYLKYLLSFPVNYDMAVRERLRTSFERGLRKSLPASLQGELEELHFSVKAGASEPAAYAACALREYGLEPKTVGPGVAYGVFDFGGGTTDFDFGVETKLEKRYHYQLERFGNGGDAYLGGENILARLAFEVFKDNLDTMRKYKIQLVLPKDAKNIAGGETLLVTDNNASKEAYRNRQILMELLRCVWENKADECRKFDKESVEVTLYSSAPNFQRSKQQKKADKPTENAAAAEKNETAGSEQPVIGKDGAVSVELKVNVNKLKECIRKRIEVGVANFFQRLEAALRVFVQGKETVPFAAPIYILLAGNSCRSPIVQDLFAKYIERESKKFDALLREGGRSAESKRWLELKQPLGEKADPEAKPKKDGAAAKPTEKTKDQPATNTAAELDKQKTTNTAAELDKQKTGKTGVAFGLLRTDPSRRDIKIIDSDKAAGEERPFPFYLGRIDENGFFETVIGRGVKYGEWAAFIDASEPEFELFFTQDSRAEIAGKVREEEVFRVRCYLEAADAAEDVSVYISKKSPDTIEFTVGTEKKLQSGKELRTQKVKLVEK